MTRPVAALFVTALLVVTVVLRACSFTRGEPNLEETTS
jgi:hypothetical protein